VKIERMSDILPHRIPRQWTAEAHTTGRGVIDRFGSCRNRGQADTYS